MTHMHTAFAVVTLAALSGLGWGVCRVLRHTSYMAGIVAQNMADGEAYAAQLQDAPEEEAPQPMGFHSVNSGS